MAAYSVSLSKHATLLAATVDVVTLTVDFREVEVRNRASVGAGIHFTTDGSVPAAGGDNTYIVLPGERVRVDSFAADVVRLISATADAYSVTGFSRQ